MRCRVGDCSCSVAYWESTLAAGPGMWVWQGCGRQCVTTVGVESSGHCTYSICLLLRIKDIRDCQWSGGFPLVNDGSLCVNMRYVFGPSANDIRIWAYLTCPMYTTLTPSFPPSHHMHMHPSPSHITYPYLSLSHTTYIHRHSHITYIHIPLHPHVSHSHIPLTHTTCTPAPSLRTHISPPLSSPSCLPTEELWGGACSFGWRLSTKGPLRLSSSLRRLTSLFLSDWRTSPR